MVDFAQALRTKPQQQAHSETVPLLPVTDIILMFDADEKLNVVTGLSPEGRAEMKPADGRYLEELLKANPAAADGQGGEAISADMQNGHGLRVDKHASMLDNFLSNFLSQARNPYRTGIYRFTRDELRTVWGSLRELLQDKDAARIRAFLEKYEIRPREATQTNFNQNQNTMAKQTQPAPAPQSEAQAPEQRAPKFNPSLIDWESLKNFGVSREVLESRGLLDQMLKGYKSSQLVPVNFSIPGVASYRGDARLSFQQTDKGTIGLVIHGIRREPELNREYYGHKFSDEDKRNLDETGNMGRTVELRDRNGEYHPSFISLDKLTNEIVSMRAENLFIPEEVNKVKLTPQDIADLNDGKKIWVEGMISKAGKEFDAFLQVSAERRGIEFIFPERDLAKSQSVGGVPITDKQREDLDAGRAIYVEDMKSIRNGDFYSAFVKIDQTTGRFAYSRYNPDSPEGAREIVIPKEINQVRLAPEDRDDLRAGRPVYLENMVGRSGEEFSRYVKLDLENGNIMYANHPDEFGQRAEFKIPVEQLGHTFTASERGKLQDGEVIFVQGLQGPGGKSLDMYIKANFNTGRLDYYNDNPDLRRQQRADQKQDQGQKSADRPAARQSAGEDQTQARKRGRGL